MMSDILIFLQIQNNNVLKRALKKQADQLKQLKRKEDARIAIHDHMDKENKEKQVSSKNHEVIDKYKRTKKLAIPTDSTNNDGDPALEGEGNLDELQDIFGNGFDALIEALIVATPAKENN